MDVDAEVRAAALIITVAKAHVVTALHQPEYYLFLDAPLGWTLLSKPSSCSSSSDRHPIPSPCWLLLSWPNLADQFHVASLC